MTTINTLASLIFGKPSPAQKGQQVVVGRIDGCMAETFVPVYEGTITGKTTLPTNTGSCRALTIQITNPLDSGAKPGHIKTELAERLRTLENGTLIIAN